MDRRDRRLQESGWVASLSQEWSLHGSSHRTGCPTLHRPPSAWWDEPGLSAASRVAAHLGMHSVRSLAPRFCIGGAAEVAAAAAVVVTAERAVLVSAPRSGAQRVAIALEAELMAGAVPPRGAG